MPETFLIADRVFDGTEVHAGVAVGIHDGTVTRLVPALELAADAAVQRYPGATITPGLIDAHVHMTPWMVFGLIAAGVTTVRDLGNDVDRVSAMIDALGDVPLPTVYWSGPLLESDKVNWPSIARAHHDTDAVLATVDELADRGVRSIKLYYNATPELVAAAADRAHSRGIRVLGHVGATSLAEAVEAGVDEIQHLAGCLAVDLGFDDWPSSARALAEYEVDHCTTLVVWDAMTPLGEPRAQRDSALAWVHPQAIEAWAEAHHATQPAAERVRRATELTERMAAIPALLGAGRGIVVGSDAPFPGLVPGFSLHDEAGLLVESGMTPRQVLTALTTGNASLMGIQEAGRIQPGVSADLAVFAGDPTERIADLSRVIGVWTAGAEVDLTRLAAQAAAVFAQPASSPVDELAELRYVPATAARPKE